MRMADPKYEEEVSGCTACVGVITHDKVYVVRLAYQYLTIYKEADTTLRAMQVTREQYSASKAEQSPCRLTTSHKTKVRYTHVRLTFRMSC